MLFALLPFANAQVDVQGRAVAVFDGDVRDPVHFRRAGHSNRGAASFGAVFGYGRRPLVVENVSDGTEVALVDDLFALDLTAAWAPLGFLQIDVDVPLYGFTGQSIAGGIDAPEDLRGFGLADTRVAALVQIVDPGPDEQGLALGLVGHADLPTGRLHTYFGREDVAAGGALVGSIGLGNLDLATRLGVQIDPRRTEGVPTGMAGSFALAGTTVVDEDTSFGVEILGEIPMFERPKGAGIPLEALGRVRFADENGAHYLAGLGVGLGGAVGEPSFRAMVGAGFGVRGHARDRDGDGIIDALDQCPKAPERRNGLLDDDGCPDRRPVLAVRPVFDDVTIEGADITLEGPVQRSWTSTSLPNDLEVDPGSVWKARATKGACLVGEQIGSIGDDDHDLDIPMERVGNAILRILVLDRNGDPVPAARVELTSADPFCVPASFVTVDGSGVAEIRVGPGEHEVRGFAGEVSDTQTYTAREGEMFEMFMVLRP